MIHAFIFNRMQGLFSFHGGDEGPWKIVSMKAIIGESLKEVDRISIRSEALDAPVDGYWRLRGVVSNERYVTHQEREALRSIQPPLGRPSATWAALIPIRKSGAWWSLAQDERRAILEERSRHIELGMKYLPAVARKLHHCRDLGEPFDFLTWFEFASEDSGSFDDLLGLLRASEEWNYVEREVDIRLIRL